MYVVNDLYYQAILNPEKILECRIKISENDYIYDTSIKSLKFDQDINPNQSFKIGGVYAANIALELLNYDNKFNNVNFENKEFLVDLRVSVGELYTVADMHKAPVGTVNALKIKNMMSLWIPIRHFLC